MNNYKTMSFGIFLGLILTGLTFAEGAEGVTTALSSLCSVLATALPIAIMLLVVLAAITYAVGQMLGAETRARATVWATAMMTGAIVAALIFIIMPYIIKILLPDLDYGTSVCGISTSSGTGGTDGTAHGYNSMADCQKNCVGKTKMCVYTAENKVICQSTS